MLLYIIILWIIVFLLDHRRIKQPHNCNIECILYAPSNLFYSAISKIPCEPVYHPKYIFHFLPELQIIKNNWKIIRKEYQQIKK